MKAIIFAGPSLPPRRRPADAWLAWRPPVGQGELYRAALERPAAIGVIDGRFEVVPTVWHKEILWAMAQGIRVFGAASTGALRAAELDVFGMTGIGRVYEDFRAGVLEDDDEVAILHGPEELGYPSLTDAMVDIRATLAAAAECGVLSAPAAASLAGTAKALFYKERTYQAALAAATALSPDALREFRRWLPRGKISRKRLDAEAVVAAIQAYLAGGAPPAEVAYTFADTVAWQEARRAAETST